MNRDMQADVAIAGAGMVGLALAIALRQALGRTFSVAVVDPTLDTAPARGDVRAFAVIPSAQRLLATLGVWDALAGGAQPITDMVITDSRLTDVMRPVFLTFASERGPEDAERAAGEPLAYMLDHEPLLAALRTKAADAGVTLLNGRVMQYNARDEAVVSDLVDGSHLTARLLVAADGAKSRLRELSGIAVHGWSYAQSAIVTTVAHEREHHGRAEEHFLPAGPFAILPLTGRRSSIVWTERTAEAARVLAFSDSEFHGELERRFGLHLGEISAVGARRAYPLQFFIARSFIGDRLALIGDAAHVIHPIAGQGLNMGLKDVAALAEEIVDAARLGLDFGGPVTLDRYQRWRRFDTVMMGVATDGLNRLFSNQSDVLRAVRDLGLGLVERLPPLKRFFVQEAAGLSGSVPRLLRGDAL